MGGAWARVRRRPGPLLALATLNLLLSLLVTAPISPPLAQAIDERPLAAAIAESADDGPRTELLEDHPELTAIAIECALIALVLWGALSWVAAGGLLSDEKFALACARHTKRMLAVGAAGLPLRLLALAGPLAAWPIIDGAHDFSTIVVGVVLGAIVGGTLWSMVTVTLDRARGVALAQPELRTFRVVRRALQLTRMRLGKTLALAALSGLGFALLLFVQHFITHLSPPTLWGEALAMTAAVLGAVARATLSTMILFAAN